MRKVELLAPAGNLEKLITAVDYGADAVYIAGDNYGLRQAAGNFRQAAMEQGVAYAHKKNAKVYVAANMICHEEDLAGIDDYIKQLAVCGVDGLIFADPAIMKIAQKVAPDLALHVSTQMSNCNIEAVKFWQAQGVQRVVLARELSLKEIAEIKQETAVELECFVHGAMCVAYSGSCVLSNYMTERDANRGGCAQSCRWKYQVIPVTTDMEQVELDGVGSFIMNSKDLCMVDHLQALIDTGVNTLKIEGRMKSIHYVATVVNTYRRALQDLQAGVKPPHENYYTQELQKASHRPFSTGFYFTEPTFTENMYKPQGRVRQYDFVGLIKEYDEQSMLATVEQRNHFRIGDVLDVSVLDGEVFTQVVAELYDESNQAIDKAPHPLQIVKLKMEKRVIPGSMLRKAIEIKD